MSSAVGLIVNPEAGRDIRRLVATASVMSHREKVAITRRVLEGMVSVGVDVVWALDDEAGIVRTAAHPVAGRLEVKALPMSLTGTGEDSTEAARLAVEEGVTCIVTLGGDGTNRAVARGCGATPLVAISTGTNNVFPAMMEGTVAGMAAGLVATSKVPVGDVTRPRKRVEVRIGDREDIALIDAAVTRDPFVATRAVWRTDQVVALVLATALPWAVGLSSIGGRLRPVPHEEAAGLYVEIGRGDYVLAAVAPGTVVDVPVRAWRVLELGSEVELPPTGGTIALDGEREFPHNAPAVARVTSGGPVVVDVPATLAATTGLAGG